VDTPQLEIQALTKIYDGKQVLDIPHLVINKGTIYGVIGPNGAGKTTLLSILAILVPPTSGNILFDGVDVTELDQHALRRQITLILQNPLLFTTTVEKNIAYGLRVRGIGKQERTARVKECLRFVGLEGFEKRKTIGLSGGELQRVAIARALALNPTVLLLDEPTANVDRASVDLVEQILRDLNNSLGITIIIASHDMNQVYRLSDEVVHLIDGRLTRAPAANLLRGRVVSQNGDLFLFDTGKLRVAVLPVKPEATHVSIPPEDIIVSHNPIATSARNSFAGKISQVSDEGESVRLVVDVGEKLQVTITKRSFAEMELNVASPVYVTFKSSSVEVF